MNKKRKPRRLWIGYVRSILLNYPHVHQREKDAVDAAMVEAVHRADGETIAAIVEMVFFRKSHTLDGAARAIGYSYSATKRRQRDFLLMVGKNLRLP